MRARQWPNIGPNIARNDQGQKAPTLTMGFSGGGLDSRALLYALNQAGRMPILYTFGQIGSLDFDLSHLLAERLGLKIAFVDTSEIDWKRESFEEAAANTQDIAISPRVVATKTLDERYGTRIDIHGYLNDSLTGGHLPAVLSNDWDAAVAYFCSWNDAFRFQQFLPTRQPEISSDKAVSERRFTFVRLAA